MNDDSSPNSSQHYADAYQPPTKSDGSSDDPTVGLVQTPPKSTISQDLLSRDQRSQDQFSAHPAPAIEDQPRGDVSQEASSSVAIHDAPEITEAAGIEEPPSIESAKTDELAINEPFGVAEPAITQVEPVMQSLESSTDEDSLGTENSQPQILNSDQLHDTSTNLSPASTESLEDQNIFFLLGVTNGTDEQKEGFLDELQQVIWEDFLEYDVKLLITNDELSQLQSMLGVGQDQDTEQQEDVVRFLEKLIPDLEEIMLEKALELKEEMVRERLTGLRTYYADNSQNLNRLIEAEKLMDEGKWYSAAHVMNSLAT